MKHKNLPVFIPHLGCPNQCTFCNQHTITQACAPTPTQVSARIAAFLSTADASENEVELAFFGGSFTAIPQEQMVAYLEAAKPFGFPQIRISTRPDAIDGKILSILARYGVTHIELGIQSTDDRVLERCRRGHTARQSQTACDLICRHGFTLGGQMMIGLPEATPQSETETARHICDWGAKQCRIYPLSVFANTPLAQEVQQGSFSPLTLAQGIRRSADALEVFCRRGVQPLRIGLCETDTMETDVIAGIYHPAFGELVASEVFYRRLTALFTQSPPPAKCTVLVPRGCLSQAIGQHRQNRLRLCRQFSLETLHFKESPDLQGFACQIQSSR